MIIGDSFTVGSGPVRGWESYAAEASRKLGWQLITAGAAGTGFVNPGRVRRNFQKSFAEELSWRPAPDLLIISGGRNDRNTRAARINSAADRLLEAVRNQWPHTKILVIGPIWMTKAPQWAYRVRDAIAISADEAEVAFLDPLGGHWGHGAILPDGVHPTRRGHVRLAHWLVAELKQYGLQLGA